MKRVDTRQDQTMIAPFVNSGWVLSTLHSGDYEFQDSNKQVVLIEDKPISKLLSDMTDGVLMRQMRGLVENATFPILLIRGQWLEYNGRLLDTRYTWEAVWNELATIQDMGVRIQIASDRDLAIQRIFELERYYSKDFHESALRGVSGSHKHTVLSLIPGLGTVKINNLWEKFPTLQAVADASETELLCDGVGQKLAKRIFEFWRT